MGTPRVWELRTHVLELAAEHRITVEEVEGRRRATASRRTRTIRLRPVRSEITYLVALHELGHLIARGRTKGLRLDEEETAWRWALEHTIREPHPRTRKRIAAMLGSYVEAAIEGRRSQRLPPAGWRGFALLEALDPGLGSELAWRAAVVRSQDVLTAHEETGDVIAEPPTHRRTWIEAAADAEDEGTALLGGR